MELVYQETRSGQDPISILLRNQDFEHWTMASDRYPGDLALEFWSRILRSSYNGPIDHSARSQKPSSHTLPSRKVHPGSSSREEGQQDFNTASRSGHPGKHLS